MGHPVTPETCAKISAARKERPLSEDARRRIGNGHARWLAEHSFPGVPTNIEYALQMLLEAADIDYEAQRRLGSKTVDFYSPSLNIVFEADGTYWHQDKIAEQVRDEYLINQGIGYVFHFSEDELDQWKVRKLAFDQKQAATGA